ncbi:hypothetical protein G5V59_08935 [Nocardioides sp. W3-2-3]|uniref:hypothetical protein n=1 Tax=Nocardioides convexus TaxID=2712224 RepID=UPI002418B526|nr:hypothetical protein [Nocardioides convexus]NHA00210.1 hypothetical protein [Nocardioides convexus]
MSPQENALRSLLGTVRRGGSWAIQRPKRAAAGLPPTVVMVNHTANVSMLGVQVDQPLDYRMASSPARGQFTLEKPDFLALRTKFARQIG